MQQIARNTAGTLTVTFYNGETPVDSTAAVTVTVVRHSNGMAVVTDAATTRTALGTYEYTLPAQASLDRFTAQWTATIGGTVRSTTTLAEVVGGFYFPLAELRAQPNLSDTAKFTTDDLEDARRWYERTVERHVGYAFVPRYAKEATFGAGRDSLILAHVRPRTLLAVTRDGTAETTTGWTLEPWGAVVRDTGTFTANRRYEVAYEHGADTPPSDIIEAGLLASRDKLLADRSGTRTRELSIRNEYGIVNIAQPGTDRPTGIPEVDAVLNAYRRHQPTVA